jgi:hypothetical protein
MKATFKYLAAGSEVAIPNYQAIHGQEVEILGYKPTGRKTGYPVDMFKIGYGDGDWGLAYPQELDPRPSLGDIAELDKRNQWLAAPLAEEV